MLSSSTDALFLLRFALSRKKILVIFLSHPIKYQANNPRAKKASLLVHMIQVYKLRNEKDVYKRQFPDRMTLLQNMGFEWEHSAVPEEWDLIVKGECWGMCSLVQ